MELRKSLLKKIVTQIGKVYNGDGFVYFSTQPLTCIVSYPSDSENPTQKPGGAFELPYDGEALEGCETFKIGLAALKRLLSHKGQYVVLTDHLGGFCLRLRGNQEYVSLCDFSEFSHYDDFMAYQRRTNKSKLLISTATGVETLVKGLESVLVLCKNNRLGEAASLATLTWGERDYLVPVERSSGFVKQKPWVLTMSDGVGMVAYGGKINLELSQDEMPYLPHGQGELSLSYDDAKLILDRIKVCKTKKDSQVIVSFDLSETGEDHGVVIKESQPNIYVYEGVEATLVLTNHSNDKAPKSFGAYFQKWYKDTECWILPASNHDTLALEGFTGDELSSVLAPIKPGDGGDSKATDDIRLKFVLIDDVSKVNRDWFIEFGVSSDFYAPSEENNPHQLQAEESRPGCCSELTLTPITNHQSGSGQVVVFYPAVHKGFSVSFGLGVAYKKNPYYRVLANLPPEVVTLKTDGRVFSFETNTVGNVFTNFCWVLWKPRQVELTP